MSWIGHVFSWFKVVPQTDEKLVQEDVTSTYVAATVKQPELTEFEVIQKKFNKVTDILVISEFKAATLSNTEQTWLRDQGNKVFFFPKNTLINMAIVRSGHGW